MTSNDVYNFHIPAKCKSWSPEEYMRVENTLVSTTRSKMRKNGAYSTITLKRAQVKPMHDMQMCKIKMYLLTMSTDLKEEEQAFIL